MLKHKRSKIPFGRTYLNIVTLNHLKGWFMRPCELTWKDIYSTKPSKRYFLDYTKCWFHEALMGFTFCIRKKKSLAPGASRQTSWVG